MIPEEMHPALMGVVPATLITSNRQGIPNITNISRVWFVDSNHVAVANHMLKKSIHNLRENSRAFIRTMDTATFSTWELDVEYIGPSRDADIFSEMQKQYEILSMMLETEMPITVHYAEIFRVLSARICEEENSHLLSKTDLYHPILEQLERKFGWDISAVWIVEDFEQSLELATLKGFGEESEALILKRVAKLSLEQEKPIRIINIRSQYQYALTTILHQQNENGIFSHEDFRKLNHHYIAIPIKADNEKIMAIICSQNDDALKFSLFNDEFLQVASRYLSKLIERLPAENDAKKRQHSIEQEMERLRLAGAKRTGAVKTNLSPRELQVAIQVARGLSNEEVAKVLFLSKRTVTTHLERIYQKLEINSRAALASYVIENGLMDASH
ncbi:response regulator transcription factor [Neobacillus bataviensis]|uniref:response regulator transcription factor n=1 Tax=Neobacillus bataviensis TaxID=220685 RepID=UPI001CC08ECD|nr:LuxR C-terminal-related transcriptional regulator [Neobacillus bataviensis]